jgi:ssDNA-binding Zn-finger/Zn-ribbon topoisomerase 1
MRVKGTPEFCPDCKKAGMVMGMSTGNIKIYGCLTCKNAQGMHLKMSNAKAAWKAYCLRRSPAGEGDKK